MGDTARDLIAHIRQLQRERDYCLAVLDLWAQVQEQGIDVGSAASFGFDSSLLSPSEARLFHNRMHEYIETLRSGKRRPLVYNFIRRDGVVTRLNPMLKAVYETDD
jgi:hypothetical protein